MNQRQRTILVTSLILLYIILLAVFAYQIFNQSGRTKVNVVVVPSDSQLTLDGERVSGQDMYLDLGQYEFTASKEGYDDKSITVDVVDDIEVIAGIALYSSNQAVLDQEDEDTALDREALGGIEASRTGKLLHENNPVLDILPYSSIKDMVAVTYGKTDTNADIFLRIDSLSTEGRKNSARWIRDKGFSLSELDIRYSEGYLNPLVDRQRAERGY